MEKPFISFIMPNYNNEHVINLFFSKFLENNTYDNYEFIVVDDGSEDNGLELLYKWQKTGKIKNMQVVAEPYIGIIATLNKALSLVKGEFIIRMDGDATLETKSFVEEFLTFYYTNPQKVGVIGANIITDSGSPFTIGRDVITENGLLNRGAVPMEEIGKRQWDQSVAFVQNFRDLMLRPAEVDTVLGVCAFCDTETARKIGGFDKNYPLWIEDDDFYLNFRLFNKKCFYLPTVIVCHRLSLRGTRIPTKPEENLFKKLLKFIWHYEDDQNIRDYKLFNKNIFKIISQFENSQEKTKICFFGKIYIEIDMVIGWREGILKQDYKYWQKKWGFDPLNPDMNFIKSKYNGTELLWRYDTKMAQEGEKIINDFIDRKYMPQQQQQKEESLTHA